MPSSAHISGMANELTIQDGTQKPLPHVVTALIAKRAELAGQIRHLQDQLRHARIALDHVDETLRLFAPEIDVSTITPRPVSSTHHAFRGEVSRVILELLRTAGGPLSTVQITERVMQDRGLDPNDKRLRLTMSHRVGACLSHWKRVRGVIRSMPGPGQVLLWELAH